MMDRKKAEHQAIRINKFSNLASVPNRSGETALRSRFVLLGRMNLILHNLPELRHLLG